MVLSSAPDERLTSHPGPHLPLLAAVGGDLADDGGGRSVPGRGHRTPRRAHLQPRRLRRRFLARTGGGGAGHHAHVGRHGTGTQPALLPAVAHLHPHPQRRRNPRDGHRPPASDLQRHRRRTHRLTNRRRLPHSHRPPDPPPLARRYRHSQALPGSAHPPRPHPPSCLRHRGAPDRDVRHRVPARPARRHRAGSPFRAFTIPWPSPPC